MDCALTVSKLIDLVMRIQLTRAIFDHPFSNMFIFGIMFPESHSFVAMPVTARTISSPFTK